MRLEDQVCSLELSRKLRELGVKQKSVFWYFGTSQEFESGKGYAGPVTNRHEKYENISAFTVAELGEMLRRGIIFRQEVATGNWGCGIDINTAARLGTTPNYIKAATEADARAKMLTYLIENGLITGV